MILLVVFAFLAGIITVLSPCILPLLPIILSSSTGGKRRPLGVVFGFILSFTFFTLFLATLVRLTGISADILRGISVVVLFLFGLTLIIPRLQFFIEQLFVKFARFAPKQNTSSGFLGGIIVGLSLGLLWTPCVGPILASVITLALSGAVNLQALFITLAYSLGTAIPMFLIMRAGSNALQNVPWLVKNSAKIQKAFGVLMLLTAIGIYFQVERQFQVFILNKFPTYSSTITSIEELEFIKNLLKR